MFEINGNLGSEKFNQSFGYAAKILEDPMLINEATTYLGSIGIIKKVSAAFIKNIDVFFWNRQIKI